MEAIQEIGMNLVGHEPQNWKTLKKYTMEIFEKEN